MNLGAFPFAFPLDRLELRSMSESTLTLSKTQIIFKILPCIFHTGTDILATSQSSKWPIVYTSTNNGCPGVIGCADIYGRKLVRIDDFKFKHIPVVLVTSRDPVSNSISEESTFLDGLENTGRPWYGRWLRFEIRSHGMRRRRSGEFSEIVKMSRSPAVSLWDRAG